MNFARYAHLKELGPRELGPRPWIFAARVNRGIALSESVLQVPANRFGHSAFSVGRLRIPQEVITLSVFVPLACFFLFRARWGGG